MNEKLVIHGGFPLSGDVSISGAKNSVLKLMAAALLTDEAVTLNNVPDLSDVAVMCDVLHHLGRPTQRHGNTLNILPGSIVTHQAPYELVSQMRAGFTVLGPILGRCGQARVALPGGCSIGKRGVDLHVKGLQALGADTEITHGYVEAQAESLVGSKIVLDTPSVGATENIMLAAVLAEGATILSNAAQEPEIVDLADFLNAMGADVSGGGTHEIIINGVPSEVLKGIHYNVVPDRIEAATYMIAAAVTGGNIRLHHVVPSHLDFVTAKLKDMGADIHIPEPNTLQVKGPDRLVAQDIVTQPYPGFPTDLQAPMMTALSMADGMSMVTETIYENRFKQVGELVRMGADIQSKNDVAVVTGVKTLSGAPVKAYDLRAGAAMVIAGLAAEGQTEILKLHHIDRGYESLVEKLAGLGANIQRVPNDESVDTSSVVAHE